MPEMWAMDGSVDSSPKEREGSGRALASDGRRQRQRFFPHRVLLWTAAAATLAALVALAVAAGVLYHRQTATGGHDGPRVDLGYATYAGTLLPVVHPPSHDGGNAHNNSESPVAIHRFLGMRYAAAPTDGLRWRAPQPPPRASSVQSATQFGASCLGMGAHPGRDEDCLFVNVWAPASASTAPEKVPVWVFIQGGGYVDNSNANYDGADVVARAGGGLVFVDFSYRVGLYGFLASERLRADGALNAGLLDQRQLLIWVQQHIARFGGDPARVVIHGGSAGAGSVALHTLAYGGRDDRLFAGAVAESVFFPTQPAVAALEYKFDRAVAAAGCQDAASPLACLRAVPADTLQRDVNVGTPLQSPDSGADGTSTTGTTAAPGFYWGPCIDGDLLEARPYTLFQQGRFVRVPMLFGVASDEGTLLVPDAASQEEAVQFLVNNYPGLGRAASPTTAAPNLAASVVAAYYPQAAAVPLHDAWFPTLAQAYGELTFVCGAMAVMDAVHGVAPSTPLFAYRYAMRDPDALAAGMGTVHMMDGAAIFGPDNIGCCAPASYYGTNGPDPLGNPGLVPVMMDYYISFVRSLDPNTHKTAHAAAWAQWRTNASDAPQDTGRRRLVIYTGGNQTAETVPADQAERCRVWLDLADVTEQ